MLTITSTCFTLPCCYGNIKTKHKAEAGGIAVSFQILENKPGNTYLDLMVLEGNSGENRILQCFVIDLTDHFCLNSLHPERLVGGTLENVF